MGGDTRELILDSRGLLENWAGFLGDQANSFVNEATAATAGSLGTLKCTPTDLWGIVFDSEATTDEFPAQRSRTNGSLVLPLTSGWTASRKLTEILEIFGVLEKTDSPGNGTTTGSSGLVDDIVKSLNPDQMLKIDVHGRNAVWLTPGQVLRSDLALTLELDGSNDAALDAILTAVAQYFTIPGLNTRVKEFSIMLQRTRLGVETRRENPDDRWAISKTFRLTFRLALESYTFWLAFQPTGLTFYVTQGPGQSGNLLDLTPPPTNSIDSVIDSRILSTLKLLQLSAGKLKNKVWWRVIIGFRLHNADIYLEYESRSQTFSGGLILGELKDPNGVVLLKGFYTSPAAKLLPTYEPGRDIDQPGGVNAPEYRQIYLGDLADSLRSLPSSLPTAIILANIAYTMPADGRPGVFWFASKLIQAPNVPQPNHKVPSPFNWDIVDARLRLIGATVQEAELFTHFTLTDLPPSDRVALLGLRFTYQTGTWKLDGSVQNLRLSMLWQFFDDNARDGLIKILGKVEIEKLTVKYTYDSSGAATKFSFDGSVNIGKLGLHMVYQHDGTSWKFEFDAGSLKGKATLQDVLNSIVEGAGNELPSFAAGIAIPPASGSDSPIRITVQRGSDPQGSTSPDDRLFFAFHLSINDGFKLSLVQVTNKDGSKTKRIVVFSVDKIPLIPKVPLLESLPQPFDELEYMWVSAEDDGWKESEVKDVNGGVLKGSNQLSYKPLSGTNKDGKPVDGSGDVVIKPGHHFVVLSKGAVVLDHVFGASGTLPPPPFDDPPQPPPDSGATFALDVVPTQGRTHERGLQRSVIAAPMNPTGPRILATNAPTKGALSFTYGPLSISAITLHYKEDGSSKVLALTMDATFDLNPITFSLLGLGIGIDLNGLKLDNLSTVGDHLKAELHGLALSFNKPPLMIAGGFEHDVGSSGEEIYRGGVGISFPPYTFVGLGEYAVFNNYKSVFIYAKLDGPLITLGFATISGVRLGLGYNSSVRTPKLEEITQFPFVNDRDISDTGNQPIKILKAMTEASPAWVTSTDNSYWFAAGLTLVAFDILAVTAVAMVQFKEAGLIISIIADAIAQMPPSVTSRSEMIAYVEIGFISEMNMIDGYFRVEAALAPTSFLLVPACRIYGGMALVYWFSPNPHAGDWVFTVGGYHRKFQKPEWYPMVPRLRFSFSVEGCLQVTGETYFAITPKVAMGGALIHVTLTVGPVSAWLDAEFDALVNFHPLHYLVEFHVAVGVSFDGDVGLTHIHISATVGAWLEIQGPAFGGTAHVDFYMFAFDIDFGAKPRVPPPMTLLEFWRMLHNPGPNVESRNTNDHDPPQSLLIYDSNTSDTQGPVQSRDEGAAIKFVLEDGNFPMPSIKDTGSNPRGGPTSTGAGSKWFVKGGSFRFRVNSDFAISKAEVTGTKVVPAPAEAKIYSRPMHVDSSITSDLVVTVKRKIGSKTDPKIQAGWKSVVEDMKPMPQAAFGKYDERLDPSKNRDPTDLLSSDPGTVNLMMGIVISAPLPELAESKIGLIKNATNIMLAGIKDFRKVETGKPGEDWLLPPFEPAQSKYLPAPLADAEKTATNQEWWDGMRTTWSALVSKDSIVNDEKDGLLAQCNEIFAWQKNQPQTALPLQTQRGGMPTPGPDSPTTGTSTPAPGETDSYRPWRLIGKLPTKLINSLEVRYLDLPRIAMV